MGGSGLASPVYRPIEPTRLSVDDGWMDGWMNVHTYNDQGNKTKHEPALTRAVVRAEYVHKYATRDAADEAGVDDGEEDEMSSVGSFESGDEDPAGTMEV